MRTTSVWGWGIVCAVMLAAISFAQGEEKKSEEKTWSMNATIIEACSCPMFCQCYFNPRPAAHETGEEQYTGPGCCAPGLYCKFNNAFRVNKGKYGKTDLAGAKFWVAGDLGGDFSENAMDWACLTFDPSVTEAQREGIAAILGHLYPVRWGSFTVEPDREISWRHEGKHAEALMDGGKAGKVVLNEFEGMNPNKPIVMHNLKYWGAPRNDGFVMMPNEVQGFYATPEGREPFEYQGTNGFMITFDIKSKDVAMAKAAGMNGEKKGY